MPKRALLTKILLEDEFLSALEKIIPVIPGIRQRRVCRWTCFAEVGKHKPIATDGDPVENLPNINVNPGCERDRFANLDGW